MESITCGQLADRSVDLVYRGVLSGHRMQREYCDSHNPTGSILPVPFVDHGKFYSQYSISLKGLNLEPEERESAQQTSVVSCVNHCMDVLGIKIPGSYLGRHLLQPTCDFAAFIKAQCCRRSKRGNSASYLVSIDSICGTIRADENEVTLIGLHLMQLKFGICTNLLAADSPSHTCNPGGQCFGLTSVVCTHRYCTYINVVDQPLNCTALNLD